MTAHPGAGPQAARAFAAFAGADQIENIRLTGYRTAE
jgi:hypothetical protein